MVVGTLAGGSLRSVGPGKEGEEEKPLFLQYPGVDFNAEDPNYWKHHFADDEDAAAQEMRLVGGNETSAKEQLMSLPLEKLKLQMARLEADRAAEIALIESRYEARLQPIRNAIAQKE